jgi:hypothetical protein
MKHILEWYEDLSEPYRTQAKNNYVPNWDGNEGLQVDMFDAIFCGFSWHESPEGSDYWSDMATKLTAQSEDWSSNESKIRKAMQAAANALEIAKKKSEPLQRQGEDYIWRPAKAIYESAENALSLLSEINVVPDNIK